ncbi:glutamate receptor ionotropic, kainate 2-like [Oppia nitens]|uniref:glutamate receptor ionotropic, kainate 2-like n=1 Tax=Oppia nitens TaxID=1686743 RepID=UPI0023D9982B|nr:glutamate receptor ionotropic, kainate 2-like [Oppia nitens]
MHVQSICEAFEIPHIETRYDFESFRADLSLNLYPRPALITLAIADLIREWQWSTFAIVYEHSSSIVPFKELLQMAALEKWTIKVFQLVPNRPFRDIFRQVRDNGCLHIILDAYDIHEVLRHALQAGALTENYHYFIMNSTESALIYDGIKLVAKALDHFEDIMLKIDPISCSNGQPWPHGTTLLNYMRQNIFYGMTGLVKFDNSGFRSNLTFDIIILTQEGYDVTGRWVNGKIERHQLWTKHYLPELIDQSFIRVTSVFNPPFFMERQVVKDYSGNDKYEGYVIDLIDELAKELNFKYIINPVSDGQWGGQDKKTGKWNGMVGEVVSGVADIAVADLTINSERERAIDFTLPFMSTGISILYKKPSKIVSLWSFMLPFSTRLWILMFAILSLVGVIQVYVGRFSPYEWVIEKPCRKEGQELENMYYMSNSLWYAIGGIMQQGSDIAPKSLSTRVIGGVWAFFTLIIASSYTANLAAFLTVEETPYPFDSVETLAAQSTIKYGCVGNGATHRFFKSSNISTYQKMAQFMDNNPEVLTSSNSIGRDTVEEADGKYAFFMESAIIEFIVERNCNLTQVGGLLDNKGYGIATRKGSKLRNSLSEAILKLQERGVLRMLKKRWWQQKYGGGACLSKPTSSSIEMGMKNVGGVFLILIGGSAFATLLAFYELITETMRKTLNRSTFWPDLTENLLYALKVYHNTKPAVNKSRRNSRQSAQQMSRNRSYVSQPTVDMSSDISLNNMKTYYSQMF